MGIKSSPRTVWTAGTVLLIIVSFIGVGAFVYGTNRYNREVAAGEELRVELSLLRATKTRLEKSVAHLDLLPEIATADWEKSLTDQIIACADQAGVSIQHLTYSSQVAESGLDLVGFTMEMSGTYEAQALCLSLLEENVAGMRFGSIEGFLGGGDSYHLQLLVGEAAASSRLTVEGTVYWSSEGTP